MFARGLTVLTFFALALAVVDLARGVAADFAWPGGDPFLVAFAGGTAAALLDLGVFAVLARGRWLAALAVLLAAAWTSAVVATFYGGERPSGPDAYEFLSIGRTVALLVTIPAVLAAMAIVMWLVPAARPLAESGAAADGRGM